jgi:hypothetical protein
MNVYSKFGNFWNLQPPPPNFYPKTYKTGINLRLHLFEIRTIVEIEAPIQAMHSESTKEINPLINF